MSHPLYKADRRWRGFREVGGPGNQPDEEILHSEKVLLVDGQGLIRGVYNGTLAFDMRRLIEDVLILKREPQTRQDSETIFSTISNRPIKECDTGA